MTNPTPREPKRVLEDFADDIVNAWERGGLHKDELILHEQTLKKLNLYYSQKYKPMSVEEIERIIKNVFEEENKYSCDYPCNSKFWIRKRIIGGCDSGDVYSIPNIQGIAKAIHDEMLKEK